MNKKLSVVFVLIFLVAFNCISQENVSVTSPEQHFKFKPGSDKNLFNYEKLIQYFEQIEKQSSKIKIEQIGNSPMGKPMYIVFISSEDNIKKLDELKEINRKLALDPILSKDEKKECIDNGKVFVLATLSMHSSEVGPSQASPLIAYSLITSNDQDVVNILKNVVFMMVPNHNPDGMNMIVDHYYKYKGTKFEGSQLPSVYHKYVGHDNNRDFMTLSQEDTKAISAITSLTWFPQVMVEKHQMGGSGVRYFVPPNHDPIAQNIDARMWNWIGVFGSNLINDMTSEGLTGISQHYLFDNYWPGSTETCLWKNVISFLTEAASIKHATPVYIEPTELSVWGKGLSEYKKSINMPLPWEGGWWKLSDIVEYEISSMYSILRTASLYRENILEFRNQLCISEVEKGRTQSPYYYILPKLQHDKSELLKLLNLLQEHGTKVFEANSKIIYGERTILKGDFVVPLNQPFRAFIKEVLEIQDYPERHYTPGGELIKPYDITSWSLPLHMGVKCFAIKDHYENISNYLELYQPHDNKNPAFPHNTKYIVFTANNNSSYEIVFKLLDQEIPVSRITEEININENVIPAGSFIIELTETAKAVISSQVQLAETEYYTIENDIDSKLQKVTNPKIALFETHFHDMDAGWTRYLFDEYNISYTVVHPENFEKFDLKSFDVLIFPSSSKSIIMEGMYKDRDDKYSIRAVPPEYSKGIGKEGLEKIMTYISEGGKIVAWGKSTDIFEGVMKEKISKKESYNYELPFKNISKELKKKGFYCPGSLVNIILTSKMPLTYGLPNQMNVFYRGDPVFKTSVPYFDMDRKVIAKFPEKPILKSGFMQKEELLINKAAAVFIRKGNGKLIMFAFNPQFRASTHVSYKLIFNALLLN